MMNPGKVLTLRTSDGFMLSSNKWDSLPLDDLLFLSMKTGVQKRLCTAGYLGCSDHTPFVKYSINIFKGIIRSTTRVFATGRK